MTRTISDRREKPTGGSAADQRVRPTSIGLIGLGLLGSSLASRLLASGFPVIGFDLDAGRRTALEQMGGRAVESTKAVADTSRRILLSLPNSDVVASVVSEMEARFREDDVLIDTTT